MTDPPAGSPSHRSHWRWVPTLYFAEGLPYAIVMIVSVIMYKGLGVSNTKIALYTSWLYLPWVIKPFWSPLVDVLRTKRWWILVMQLLLGAGLAGVALTIPTSNFLQYSLAFLWLMAFSSATHDIAADGFYMLALSSHEQAWFVGIRNTFYRLAMIAGQGLLVMLAGWIESSTGLPDVGIEVHAVQKTSEVISFDPEAVVLPARSGPPQLVVRSATLEIGLQRQSADQAQRLVDLVQKWNVQHGFYEVDSSEKQQAAAAKPSWQIGLENFIRDRFGQNEAPVASDGRVGNLCIAYLGVGGEVKPGESIVINFAKSSGGKDIRIVEGKRFLVTAENANVPMASLLQLDPKLDSAAKVKFTARSGNSTLAWATVFYVLAALFLAFFAYHFFAIPRPETLATQSDGQLKHVFMELMITFATFFQKKHILALLAFILFYRFAEAQLAKMAAPFMLDARQVGGLGLTTTEVGVVYGTVGVLMLTLGGILGGWVAAKQGLKFWLWPMAMAINLPNVVYIFLSQIQPESYLLVNLAVGVEQFGYGFGFTAFMLYLLYASRGQYQTAHYAICTGFMALGMMIPGMISGWLQELIGYQHFFIWVILATIPGFVVTYFIPLDSEFGKETSESE